MAKQEKDLIPKDLHKNHRERLRKKFMENDGDFIEPHELIELLLYYVYTQKNTNHIARMLIQKFGSIYNIFEASEKELMSVPGVGPQAATLLKLQATLMRRYYIDKFNAPKNMKITPQNAGEYIINFFHGYSKEMLLLLTLDADCRVISVQPMAKGTSDQVHTFISEISKEAMHTKATYAIVAHNHPNGALSASESDLKFTLELEKALIFAGTRLIDHIIVADNKYLSLATEYKIFDIIE